MGSVHQPQVSGPLGEASRGAHSCQEVASAFFLWLRGPGFPRLSHVSSVLAGKGRKETAQCGSRPDGGHQDGAGVAQVRRQGRLPGRGPGKSPCGVRLCCAGLEFWPLPLACFVGTAGGAADTPCLPPPSLGSSLSGLLPCRSPPCPTPAVLSVQTRPDPQRVDGQPARLGSRPHTLPGHPQGLWASPHELWLLDLDAAECDTPPGKF